MPQVCMVLTGTPDQDEEKHHYTFFEGEGGETRTSLKGDEGQV